MAHDFSGAFQKLDMAFGKASEKDGFGEPYRQQRVVDAVARGPEEFFLEIANTLGTSDPTQILAEANRIALQLRGGDVNNYA